MREMSKNTTKQKLTNIIRSRRETDIREMFSDPSQSEMDSHTCRRLPRPRMTEENYDEHSNVDE